jgi:3-dehydrosphinganine reductase
MWIGKRRERLTDVAKKKKKKKRKRCRVIIKPRLLLFILPLYNVVDCSISKALKFIIIVSCCCCYFQQNTMSSYISSSSSSILSTINSTPYYPTIVFSTTTLLLLLWSFTCPPLSYLLKRGKTIAWKGKHILITGGSKGLGKSLAKYLVSNEGALVTIVARTKSDVDSTVAEINSIINEKNNKPTKTGRIRGYLCDVTDIKQVEDMIKSLENNNNNGSGNDDFGPIDHFIACAGMALTGKFVDRSFQDFESQMKLNYLGAVAPLKIIIPNMIRREQRGSKIVLVASQAALTGCVGYSAYCPSKYALRGLGESLRNELLPHGIDVHVAFPGNMKTPGYEIEQATKPPETKEIEAGEPLQEPDDVAKAMINSLHKGEYALFGGNYSSWATGRMSAGLVPRSSLLVDLVATPILILVAWAHRTFILDAVVMKKRSN